MKQIILFLLLIASGAALAQPGTPNDLDKLESTLTSVLQEQQTVYQDYQMTKELRLMEVREGNPLAPQYPYGTTVDTAWPNYDDIVRMQMEHEQRIDWYTTKLKSLLQRYTELENQRKALRELISRLKQNQSE